MTRRSVTPSSLDAKTGKPLCVEHRNTLGMWTQSHQSAESTKPKLQTRLAHLADNAHTLNRAQPYDRGRHDLSGKHCLQPASPRSHPLARGLLTCRDEELFPKLLACFPSYSPSWTPKQNVPGTHLRGGSSRRK